MPLTKGQADETERWVAVAAAIQDKMNALANTVERVTAPGGSSRRSTRPNIASDGCSWPIICSPRESRSSSTSGPFVVARTESLSSDRGPAVP